MKTSILLYSLIFLSFSLSAYYGRHATEANLEFDGRIELPYFQLRSLEQIHNDAYIKEEVEDYIYEQVQYLMGIYNSDSFLERTKNKAATISNNINPYKFLKVEESKSGSTILYYRFSGKILVNKAYFGKNGTNKTGEIPVILPLNYEKIYELGVREVEVPVDFDDLDGERELKSFNLCTDDHYNSEGDFFYFWDPDRKNNKGRRGWSYPHCPLKNDDYNVVRVTGKLTRINNSYQKYLEYDRLYKRKKLKISLFVGYVNDEQVSLDRFDKEDSAIDAVETVLQRMNELGYEIKEEHLLKRLDYSLNEFKEKGINRYYKLEAQRVRREPVVSSEKGKKQFIDIEVEILLADTSVGSEDHTFHHLYERALKESDIIVYDGHSGLGANLDLETLGIKLPKKYQVFYFNGCSSYRYFKDSYIAMKPGKEKNIDIILSGITTLSDTAAPNILAFVEGFLQGKTLNSSYILKKIEDANYDLNGTYLTGILGETNNIWVPLKNN